MKHVAIFLTLLVFILGAGMAISAPPSSEERLFNAKMKTLEQRMDGMDRALAVKTAELDRRLAELNNLRQEVINDREMFERKETALASNAGQQARHSASDSAIASLDKRLTIVETRMIVWGSAITAFFILVQFLVHWLGLGKGAVNDYHQTGK